MFDHMIPAISEILADIRDELIPINHQESAESETFIDESNPTGPEKPWDWNEFYKYFSMVGLQNSNAFINSILNTPSKLSNYEHYKRTGIQGFSKKCND